MKKTSTVDYTCDDMSMDVNKVLYASVRPHQETVAKDEDQDPSVTSSIAATKNQHVCVCVESLFLEHRGIKFPHACKIMSHVYISADHFYLVPEGFYPKE